MTSEDDGPTSAGRTPDEADGTGAVTGGGEQRAEVDERRLHPAWVLTRTLAVLRGLVPALIGIAVGLREWIVPAAAAIAVVVIGLRILEWRATRYAVVDGGLRLRSGILARRERVVPASRISALDTSRGVVQRAFGLVSLEVQTAGGGKHAELKLDALTFDEAERLRAALGHARRSSSPPEPPRPEPVFAPQPEPVYAVSARELVIAALTGPQLGLVGVLVGSLFSQAGDLVPDSIRDRVGDEVSGADATTVVVLVLLGLVAAATVSVVATVLAFAEFQVVRDDRRLRVRRGLLTERTGTIALDRIHGVRIVEGLLRRPLGYASVQVEVAGYRGDDDLTRTLIPLVRRRELPALLARMLPEVPWPDGDLERPPTRARRRYWTVPVLVSLVPAAFALALPGAWFSLAVVPPVLGLLLGDARWRGAGWSLGPETLAVRHQLLARTTLLALARRVQHVDRHSQPFQRRADLAAFDVVLATGRHGAVRHLDAATADDLQRRVRARTSRRPSPAVRRDGSLSFAAPPE